MITAAAITRPALVPVEGHATATASRDESTGGWTVRATFVSSTPVDRATNGYSWGLRPSHASLAARLVRAINDGVVFTDFVVGTDINSKTYLSARNTILSRTMNADLSRLGY